MVQIKTRSSETLPKTAHLLRELVSRESQVLYGEEDRDQRTGKYRTFKVGNGVLVAAVYSRNRRAYMANKLADILGYQHGLGLPLGHVDFRAGGDTSADPKLSGAVYALRKGNIINASIEHDPEAPLTPESRDCFDLARTIGIGDMWTETAFDYVANENLRAAHFTRALNVIEAEHLDNTLEGLVPTLV